MLIQNTIQELKGLYTDTHYKQMNLENVMLSEISQSQNVVFYVIPFIYIE